MLNQRTLINFSLIFSLPLILINGGNLNVLSQLNTTLPKAVIETESSPSPIIQPHHTAEPPLVANGNIERKNIYHDKPGNYSQCSDSIESKYIESLGIDYVDQYGGTNYAVDMDENYAYVGMGHRLVVFDISNLSYPRMVGRTAPTADIILDIDISGSYAFTVAYQFGLVVFDISNPMNPAEVGYFSPLDTYPVYDDLVVSYPYAYLASQTDGIFIIDISTPDNPVGVGHYYENNLYANSVQVSGGYLIVGTYEMDFVNGLHIISVADPSDPIRVGFLGTSGHVEGLAARGSYVYLADNEGFLVVDISQPTNPVQLSRINRKGKVLGISSTSVFFYSSWELVLIDVTKPEAPELISNLSLGSNYIWDLAVYDTDVVMLLYYPVDLMTVDISNLSQPVNKGRYKSIGLAYDVAVSDSNLFVADFKGLYSFDITDPSIPLELAFLPIYLIELDIQGSYVYGLTTMDWERKSRLVIIDISNPNDLVEVGEFSFIGESSDLFVVGDFAYVAAGTGGVQIVNISDPSLPHLASNVDPLETVYGIWVSGDLLYVSDSTRLRIINVSNPSTPIEIGTYLLHGISYDVTASGPYAYVATTFSTFG